MKSLNLLFYPNLYSAIVQIKKFHNNQSISEAVRLVLREYVRGAKLQQNGYLFGASILEKNFHILLVVNSGYGTPTEKPKEVTRMCVKICDKELLKELEQLKNKSNISWNEMVRIATLRYEYALLCKTAGKFCGYTRNAALLDQQCIIPGDKTIKL